LAGTSLAGATITQAQALNPFSQFTSVTKNGVPLGSSSYNGLEIRLNKRLSDGVSFMAAYTFSKTMEAVSYEEPQYTTLEHVLADFDRSQHLTLSALLALPFGNGKRIGGHWNRTLDLLAGNWQYNIIYD
jgi:hypothetical protein